MPLPTASFVFQKTRAAFQNLLLSGLELALPWQCLLCQSTDRDSASAVPSLETQGQRAFCVKCRQSLAPEISNSCDRCGAVVGPHVSTSKGCVHCRRKTIHFESVICLSMYDDEMRKAVLSAKWSHSAVMIDALGNLLATERRSQLLAANPDLILPVPQAITSRCTRHFNSAAQVAMQLSRFLNVRCDAHILRRRRYSRPQKRVAVHQRFENQAGSFGLRDAHLVAGKRILLVDDVLTTGATCSEAARLLKNHGAKVCHVAVVARVLDASA